MASDSLIDQNDSAKATDATDSKKLISDEIENEINSANTCNGDESHENCLSVIEKSAVTALHSTSSSNLTDEIMVVDKTEDGIKNSNTKPNTMMTTLNHTRTAVSTPESDTQPKEQPLIYRYNQSKWNIAFYCILLRCICDGIEYSIIIPSLKNYLDTAFTWEDPENPPTIKWNSYVLASYQLGSIFSLVVFGYLRDKHYTGKSLMLFCCACSITGNLIYFLAPIPQLLCLGRFICGLTVLGLHLAEIGKHSHLDTTGKTMHITWVFVSLNMCQILGPVTFLAMDLLKIDFELWEGKQANQYNFGAVVTAVLYTISFVLTLIFYQPEYFIREDFARKRGCELSEVMDEDNECTRGVPGAARYGQVGVGHDDSATQAGSGLAVETPTHSAVGD